MQSGKAALPWRRGLTPVSGVGFFSGRRSVSTEQDGDGAFNDRPFRRFV